jgi:hypothetical protein
MKENRVREESREARGHLHIVTNSVTANFDYIFPHHGRDPFAAHAHGVTVNSGGVATKKWRRKLKKTRMGW